MKKFLVGVYWLTADSDTRDATMKASLFLFLVWQRRWSKSSHTMTKNIPFDPAGEISSRDWQSMVLLSETEAQIIKNRSKGKHIEPETTISALKTRAEAIGCTKGCEFAKEVLNHWIDHHFVDHNLTGWLREGKEMEKESQVTCVLIRHTGGMFFLFVFLPI